MSWQTPVILWPDVEALVCTRLRSLLSARSEPHAQGVWVSNAVPDPRRDRMVIVRRDGGTARGERDRARLTVRCWATTPKDAADLGRLTAALLQSLPGLGGVLQVIPVSGPTRLPDESGQPSVYLTTEVHMRGEQL